MDIEIIILIVILILFVGFCLYMAFKTSKNNKQQKKKLEYKKNQYGASIVGFYAHFYGLPLPELKSTHLYWCKNKIIMEADQFIFNLNFDKLTDVCIKTDVEIKKQYVSSAGGAVAGAVMFGALGALIGGRTKEKTTKQINKYLIFTYCDNNEIKYIAFSINDYSSANKFVKAFKELPTKEIKSFDL